LCEEEPHEKISCGFFISFFSQTIISYNVQETDNDCMFSSKLYLPSDCQSEVAGEGVWKKSSEKRLTKVGRFFTV